MCCAPTAALRPPAAPTVPARLPLPACRRHGTVHHAVGPEFLLAEGDLLFFSGGCFEPAKPSRSVGCAFASAAPPPPAGGLAFEAACRWRSALLAPPRVPAPLPHNPTYSGVCPAAGLLDRVTEVAASHGLTPWDSSLEQLDDPAIAAAFNTKGARGPRGGERLRAAAAAAAVAACSCGSATRRHACSRPSCRKHPLSHPCPTARRRHPRARRLHPQAQHWQWRRRGGARAGAGGGEEGWVLFMPATAAHAGCALRLLCRRAQHGSQQGGAAPAPLTPTMHTLPPSPLPFPQTPPSLARP